MSGHRVDLCKSRGHSQSAINHRAQQVMVVRTSAIHQQVKFKSNTKCSELIDPSPYQGTSEQNSCATASLVSLIREFKENLIYHSMGTIDCGLGCYGFCINIMFTTDLCVLT